MPRRRYTGPAPQRSRTGCQAGQRCDGPYVLVLMQRELGPGTVVRRLCPDHAKRAELSRRFVGYAEGQAA